MRLLVAGVSSDEAGASYYCSGEYSPSVSEYSLVCTDDTIYCLTEMWPALDALFLHGAIDRSSLCIFVVLA